MTVSEARDQLKIARKKLRKTMQEVATLMAFIRKKGGDPSGRPDTDKRDQQIFRLRQRGHSAREIALRFKLSTDRVRAICAKLNKPKRKRKSPK